MRRVAIAILGAGLAGSCAALELARRGHSVLLIDRDSAPLNRASRRNEGKVHLGLTYAADRSLATAELQLRGALSFRLLLERWLGPAAHALRRSSPFVYLVATNSILHPDELAEHYSRVETLYRKQIAENSRLDYVGSRPVDLVRPLPPDEIAVRFQAGRFSAGFSTEEVAIDTDQLADLVAAALRASPLVTFLPQHEVRELGRVNGRVHASGSSPAGPWKLAADQLVNATWENRLALDASLGLDPPPGWLHRLKYRVLVRLPRQLHRAPSATVVLGRYGDVVVRRDGTAYLSWYPAGLRGWTDELAPPPEWDAPCSGRRTDCREEVAQKTIQGIEAWYPGIGSATPFQIDAGAIVAYGRTDVDHRQSELHDRTRIGVWSDEGYHSFDPGKLTTAPLFAMEAAERVIAGDPSRGGEL